MKVILKVSSQNMNRIFIISILSIMQLVRTYASVDDNLIHEDVETGYILRQIQDLRNSVDQIYESKLIFHRLKQLK